MKRHLDKIYKYTVVIIALLTSVNVFFYERLIDFMWPKSIITIGCTIIILAFTLFTKLKRLNIISVNHGYWAQVVYYVFMRTLYVLLIYLIIVSIIFNGGNDKIPAVLYFVLFALWGAVIGLYTCVAFVRRQYLKVIKNDFQ